MKGKLRILSFILIGVMFCNIEVANAVVQKSATAYLVPAPASGSLFYSIPKCVTNEDGEEVCNGYEDYHDNQFEVVMDGKTLEGFCLDAGYGATTRENGGFSLTCNSIESYRTAKAIKYILEKAPNHLIKQLALRFIAYDMGFARTPQDHGKYISQYWDGRYPDLGPGLIGDPAAEAKRLAQQALKEAALSSGSKEGTNEVRLTLDEVVADNENEYIVRYKVRTVQSEDMDVTFECEESECSIIEGAHFQGQKGTVTVKVKNRKGNCKYTLYAKYFNDKRDLYICTPDGTHQQILTSVVEEEGLDRPSETAGRKQTFKYNVPASSDGKYYKNWCDVNDDNPDKCEGEGSKTEITKSAFCDISNGSEISIKAPTNVKNCILKETDEAGYTYQDTSSVRKNNPYCSVYCKEDYNMDLPGAQFVNSGASFKLDNAKVSGTRTCYITGAANNDVVGIDITKFKEDVEGAQRALIDAYNSYAEEKNINQTYKHCNITSCSETDGSCAVSCSDRSSHSSVTINSEELEKKKKAYDQARNRLEKIVEDIGQCYNWDNNFCFHPDAEFDYKEDYSKDINYKMKDNVKTTNEKTTGGTAINKKYDISGEQPIQKNISYINCNEDGSNCNQDNTAKINPEVKFIKKEITKEAEYNNVAIFASNIPVHTITKKELEDNPDKYLLDYEYLGAVFPVMVKTPKGVYNWTLNFQNVGQYNDNNYKINKCDKNTDNPDLGGNLGRLNEVTKVLNEEAGYSPAISSDIGYVCIYAVNIDDCPDCPIECECEDPDQYPDGYSCEKTGQFTCIIKGPDGEDKPEEKCDDCEVYCVNCIFDGKDTFSYRTISVSAINPNERTMGSNWSSNRNKAQITKTEIEREAEEVYKEATYSFTINPTQMKEIRKYNDQKSSYADSDMTYHDYVENDKHYIKAVGYSDFLRNHGTDYFTTTKTDKWDKWEFWQEFTQADLDNKTGIGPSWK